MPITEVSHKAFNSFKPDTGMKGPKARETLSFLFLNRNIYVKSHEELIIILKCAWKFGQQ